MTTVTRMTPEDKVLESAALRHPSGQVRHWHLLCAVPGTVKWIAMRPQRDCDCSLLGARVVAPRRACYHAACSYR